MKRVVDSARCASSMRSRAAAAACDVLVGDRAVVEAHAERSSSHTRAVIAIRSITPAKSLALRPAAAGSAIGLAPRRSRISATTPLEVGADAIALVDEGEARARRSGRPGATPSRSAARTPSTAVEHRDRAVEHAQGALDLHGEVDVAGGVDQVDQVAAPSVNVVGGGGDA